MNMKSKIKFELKETPIIVNGFYYYFYKIINLTNNNFYYGVHKTKNLEDGYAGSGYLLKKAIKQEGIDNYKKEILKFFQNVEEMMDYEKFIVNDTLVKDKNCYNAKLGGFGGWELSINKVTVRDENGNCYWVDKCDPRYLSKQLKHNCVGHINVIDNETNKHVYISTQEYYLNKYKYSSFFNDKVTVKNGNGEYKQISKSEFDNGDYVGTTKGLGVFKDKDGKAVQCSIEDSRVLSGELVGYTKGLTCYKYKHDFSKTVHTTKNDPRVISGELVGINYGIIHCINPITLEKISVEKGDPRLQTGELITTHKYSNNKKRKSGISLSTKKQKTKTDYYNEFTDIIKLYQDGKSNSEIKKILNIPYKKIYYIIDRYKQAPN